MTHHVTATMIVVGLVLAGQSTFSGGRYDQCGYTVAARLAELNITQADVVGVTYVPEYRGASRTTMGVVIGVKAWVSLESCKGSVIISMNERCHIKQTRTRGQCEVPGLKNY